MKKKVVLVAAFVLLVLSSIALSSNSADAKTYKRKIIDNWEFKNVRCFPEDDVQLKVNKKIKYTFGTNAPDVMTIDNKGHVTFKTIGAGTVYAVAPNGQKYECTIRINPHIFEAENLTIKVGETVSPKLNFGDAPLPEKLYYNMNTAHNYFIDVVDFNRNKEDGLYTITGLEPGEVLMVVGWQDCSTSFTVTVVE